MLGGSRDSGGQLRLRYTGESDSSTPVVAARHSLPPLGRSDLEEIQRLVRDECCFVLHAALRTRHDTNPLALLNVGIDALILVLRQLRAGCWQRPAAVPRNEVLCDYRTCTRSEIFAGGSAFNIRAASRRSGDFDEADVHALLGQQLLLQAFL